MRSRVAAALWFLVGVVNLVPITGVLSADRLHTLYGVTLTEPNLIVLMRHRAVLFGVIGGLLIAAAFRPTLRRVAFVAGLVSMLSFVAVGWSVGGLNAELNRIVVIDVVASALLAAAFALGRSDQHAQAR